jgi:hypothetical protein
VHRALEVVGDPEIVAPQRESGRQVETVLQKKGKKFSCFKRRFEAAFLLMDAFLIQPETSDHQTSLIQQIW